MSINKKGTKKWSLPIVRAYWLVIIALWNRQWQGIITIALISPCHSTGLLYCIYIGNQCWMQLPEAHTFEGDPRLSVSTPETKTQSSFLQRRPMRRLPISQPPWLTRLYSRATDLQESTEASIMKLKIGEDRCWLSWTRIAAAVVACTAKRDYRLDLRKVRCDTLYWVFIGWLDCPRTPLPVCLRSRSPNGLSSPIDLLNWGEWRQERRRRQQQPLRRSSACVGGVVRGRGLTDYVDKESFSHTSSPLTLHH